MAVIISIEVPDFHIYQEAIDAGFSRLDETYEIDEDAPIVVAIFLAPDLALQYFVPIKGTADFYYLDLLRRKAQVVKYTGMTHEEAWDATDNDGVDLIGDWLPSTEGTTYQGASPVFCRDKLAFIVAVSGQKHDEFDQPLSEFIANELQFRIEESQ